MAVSTVVSLTVTPMICAHFIRHAPDRPVTRLDRIVEGIMDWATRAYAASLGIALRFRFLTILVMLATVAATVPRVIALIRTSGVRPIVPRMLSKISAMSFESIPARRAAFQSSASPHSRLLAVSAGPDRRRRRPAHSAGPAARSVVQEIPSAPFYA